MYPNFEEILEELSYKVGIVDLTNESHKQILVKLLRERGIDSAQQLTDRASVVFEYIKEVLVKSKSSGNIYPVKKFNPDTQVKPTDSELEKSKTNVGVSDDEKNAEPTPTQTEPEVDYDKLSSEKKKKIVQTKTHQSEPINKKLKKIDTLKTNTFNAELEPNDSEFEKLNKDIKNPIPPQPYKIPENILKNTKFPKKYIKALERIVNTRPTGDGTKWSHYSNIPGGAGQISAQAGELMTLIGSTMDDNDFNSFYNSLVQHEQELTNTNPKLKSESTRIVSKSWIDAAKNNRSAILKRLNKEYPGATIVASSWDTKNDVESLGLENYEENKGHSTDIYLKIKLKDGKEILNEISLKKSTVVYFVNSGAGKFSDWDSELPDNLNIKVYNKNERNNLVKTATTLKNDIKKLLDSDSDAAKKLKDVIKSKGIDFETALDLLSNGKGNRARAKVVYSAIVAIASEGNDIAKNHIINSKKSEKQFTNDSIKAIIENPKMKEGMLSEIRNEFPLKSISSGEETMAIGDLSLDKAVMENIFGTSNYDEIKEKLVAEQGNPPYIGYKADINGKIIPLASIYVREDGVGYGGIIKFEMSLDSRFAVVLDKANKEIYG
jgi:hypothetical protein